MVRALPRGRALVIRGGLSPVIVKTPKAWRMPEYRAARRRGQATAALVPAQAHRSVGTPDAAGAQPDESVPVAAEPPVLEAAGSKPAPGYPWSRA